jgi:hypothetical protein
MKLRPGLEIQGPCCGQWHVLFQPDGWESDGTAARDFLYWRCPKRGGRYYGGSVGQEPDRHPVREPGAESVKEG